MKTFGKLIFAWIVLASSSVFAGGNAGGGGSRIESAFRLRATELIERISQSHEADSLCPSTLLRKTLNSTRVRVVNKIIDRRGKCSKAELLDACTYKHDIQLLGVKWESHFQGGLPDEARKSIDTLVLHELYRATGATCADDQFVLSLKTSSLLGGMNGAGHPTSYAQATSCPVGTLWSPLMNFCASEAHCSKGLVQNPYTPTQCLNPTTGGDVVNQQCRAGYTLTAYGCFPACPTDAKKALMGNICVAAHNPNAQTAEQYFPYNGLCYSRTGTIVDNAKCAGKESYMQYYQQYSNPYSGYGYRGYGYGNYGSSGYDYYNYGYGSCGAYGCYGGQTTPEHQTEQSTNNQCTNGNLPTDYGCFPQGPCPEGYAMTYKCIPVKKSE